jgi:hypothetical protein
MMTVAEIEAAISRLSAKELSELIGWLQEYAAEAWDRRIEADLEAGRLDGLLSDVEAEYKAGLSRPL